jgi:hypothetical protein
MHAINFNSSAKTSRQNKHSNHTLYVLIFGKNWQCNTDWSIDTSHGRLLLPSFGVSVTTNDCYITSLIFIRRENHIKMDLKRDRMGWYGLDLSGSGQGPVESSCEHGDERSGCMTCWEILECLSDWRLSSMELVSFLWKNNKCSRNVRMT